MCPSSVVKAPILSIGFESDATWSLIDQDTGTLESDASVSFTGIENF